jgi:hypothetical protein
VSLAVNNEPRHAVELGRVALFVANEEREAARVVGSVRSLGLQPELGVEILRDAAQAELFGDLGESLLDETVRKAVQGRDRVTVLQKEQMVGLRARTAGPTVRPFDEDAESLGRQCQQLGPQRSQSTNDPGRGVPPPRADSSTGVMRPCAEIWTVSSGCDHR